MKTGISVDRTCILPVQLNNQPETSAPHNENVEGHTLIAKAGRGRGRKPRGEARMGPGRGGGGGRGRGIAGGGGGGEGAGLPTNSTTTTTTSTDVVPATGKTKRAQYCTICKNHNLQVLKKRHKCPFKDCTCALCNLSRRVQCVMCHQQRLWRFRKSQEKKGEVVSATSPSSGGGTEPPTSPTSSSPSPSPASGFVSEGLQEAAVDDPLSNSEASRERLKAERSGKQQVCDKCRNHDHWVLKRGHKGKCPFENCKCKYCDFTIKRRDLMKHQQRVRRAQVTAVPAEKPQDFVLLAAEKNNGEKKDISASPVRSPARLAPSNGQERQITNKENNADNTQSSENQVSWTSCSNEDSSSQETSVCPQPSGETLHSPSKPTGESTLSSEAFQNIRMTSSSFPCSNKNSTLNQTPNTDTTPFHEPTEDSSSFQSLSGESTVHHLPNRDFTPLEQPSRDSKTFQIPCNNSPSPPYQSFQYYPSRNSPHHTPVRESTQFHHNNHESTQFHHNNHESTQFQPMRESTPFPNGSSESTQFQQPLSRGPTPFHHNNSESPPFYQSLRESTPFQHDHCHSPQIHQTVRGPTPFPHSSSDSPPFQQTFQHGNTNMSSYQQPMSCSPLSHYNGDTSPYQSRDTPAFPLNSGSIPYQQQYNESTIYQQQVPVTHVADYSSKLTNTMDVPLRGMKTEPNLDDEMTYDSNGNFGPSVNYMTATRDYAALRNYDNSNSVMNHFSRNQPQPKFGVQPEDFMLRQWPTSSIEQEEEMVDSKAALHNRIEYRKTSACSITSHIQQQPMIIPQQHQMQQSQSCHFPVMTKAESRNYESSAISLTGSSGLPVSTPMTPTASLSRGLPSSSNFVQANLSAMDLTACKAAFVPPSTMQGQSMWWQARLPNLERTNSG